APPAAPDVALSVSADSSARSGENATGTLTIINRDVRTVTLQVSIAPSGGWSPRIPDADQNRVLAPGATSTVRLTVLVPELEANATNSFPITVRARTSDGGAKDHGATWTVTGLARERSEPTPTSEPESSVIATPTAVAPRGGAARAGANLDVYVDPLEVEIPSGGTQTAMVQLHNTGDVALVVTLQGVPPPSWRNFAFAPDAVVTLAPGERADVPMTITAPDAPPGGRADAKVMAVADNNLVRSASFILRTVPSAPRDTTTAAAIEAPASPDGGLPVQGPSVLIVTGLAAVGGAAVLVASRPLREKLLWLGAGLYTRLARPDVLGHEDREKLYRLVETQPGIHFHALQRDLAWNTGTLTYHLRVLERHGFVVSRRDGLYRRFYLSGAAPRKEVFENQGPTGLRADVLEAIRNAPGISQSDLALGLGANKQTVNYHVKALERAGTIRVEKRGRDTYLFPGGAVAPPGRAEA
ncbi:MAG TPA: winged helix-turn-helix transcriptional regulator, partial [Candidatus Thermoplasmatota archaeon]|nr:winged helix-turn-helix transcriptional regulator [Candidatus Thermoplasmatota archaeon]